MHKRGIQWEQLGTHNEPLSILDFKIQERAKEGQHLEGEIKSNELILGYRKELLDGMERSLTNLMLSIKRKAQLDSEIMEKEKALAETTAAVTENQALIEQTAKKVIALKEADEITDLENAVRRQRHCLAG